MHMSIKEDGKYSVCRKKKCLIHDEIILSKCCLTVVTKEEKNKKNSWQKIKKLIFNHSQFVAD